MKIRDARTRDAAQPARAAVRDSLAKLLVGAPATAMLIWHATAAVDDSTASAAWFISGACTAWQLDALLSGLNAVQQLRRVRRCTECRAASLARQAHAAHRCAQAGAAEPRFADGDLGRPPAKSVGQGRSGRNPRRTARVDP